jgi:hypothetical protein
MMWANCGPTTPVLLRFLERARPVSANARDDDDDDDDAGDGGDAEDDDAADDDDAANARDDDDDDDDGDCGDADEDDADDSDDDDAANARDDDDEDSDGDGSDAEDDDVADDDDDGDASASTAALAEGSSAPTAIELIMPLLFRLPLLLSRALALLQSWQDCLRLSCFFTNWHNRHIRTLLSTFLFSARAAAPAADCPGP